jgi:peptidoglycan/LPS O-acetylase OafA/YrhL
MYFPQLTFPRYIAAVIVLATHFGQIREILSIPGLGDVMHYSNTLLCFFFVLTGFVLILSINRNNQLPPATTSYSTKTTTAQTVNTNLPLTLAGVVINLDHATD